jgi:uncharacterized protein YidB (DUF937 family)
MSLLGDLVGGLTGGGGSGGNQAILNSAVEMLNNHPGGISGVLQNFHAQGLGELASSWVGNGQNLPVSPEQIQSVLGNEQVQQFAQKLGISPDAASGHLAQLLPALVDHLSPNGQAPQGGIEAEGLSLLQGFLSKGSQPAES